MSSMDEPDFIAIGPAPSPAEVDEARSPAGGWSRDQLAAWGVPWPPPKGWRTVLAERHRQQVEES